MQAPTFNNIYLKWTQNYQLQLYANYSVFVEEDMFYII